MKKKVSMSVRTLVYAILFAVGAFFAIRFGTDWHNYMHPVELSLVGRGTLANNSYVKCEINEVIATKGTYLGLYDYTYYVVRLYDGTYIDIGIYDIALNEAFEDMAEGKKNSASFVGKIVKNKISANQEFYDLNNIDTSLVNKNYAIEETVNHAAMNKCLLAAFLTIVSLFGFIGSFSVRYQDEEILDEKPSSDSSEFEGGVRTYGKSNKKKQKYINLDYEYEVAQKRVERITQQMEGQRRLLVPSFAFIVGGILLLVFSKNSFMVLGIVLIAYGVIKIWKVFFNSGSKLAVGLADTFSINTLYKQLKHAEAQRSEIENEINHKKSHDTKIFSNMGRSKDKAVVLDCDQYPAQFMIRIDSDLLYAIKHGEDSIHLKIVTDVLLREEQLLVWGSRKKDISKVLDQASRDIFFIHFDDVDALWLVANDQDYSVAPVTVFRLYSNGNVTSENINVGLDYELGDVLNPSQLTLRRTINCLGPVVTTADYSLNNLGKPQLAESDERYYYIDSEFVDEVFAFDRDIIAWQVPVQEDNIDVSMESCPMVRIPEGTQFVRMRVPRKASRSYIDLSLEDGRIIRVTEEHRTIDDKKQQIMLDAQRNQFGYAAVN